MTVSFPKFLRWFFSVLSVLALAILARELSRSGKVVITPVDDVSFQWHPKLYRFITFGHAPAAVDLLLIRFLGEDTLKHVNEGSRAKAFYLLELATDLDPNFFHLYNSGASYLTVVRNDNVGALKLLQKAEVFRKEKLPLVDPYIRNHVWEQAWRIPFLKGYVHLFEFDDLTNAKSAYGELDGMTGVPEIMRNLSERFNRPFGEYEVGLRVLQTMLWTEKEKRSPDERVIEEIEIKQSSLQLSYELRRLNQLFDDYVLKVSKTERVVEKKEIWNRFVTTNSIPLRDRWGGRIYLDDSGRANSTTPRIKVLGLD